MPSKLAIEKAAQVWCRPEVSHKEMDVELGTAFAEVLDEIWSKPWLGNATTKELIDELSARIEVQAPGLMEYKTTGEDVPQTHTGGTQPIDTQHANSKITPNYSNHPCVLCGKEGRCDESCLDE